jgi:hypothetical protein
MTVNKPKVMRRFDRLLQVMAGEAGRKSEAAPQSSNAEPSRGYDETRIPKGTSEDISQTREHKSLLSRASRSPKKPR